MCLLYTLERPRKTEQLPQMAQATTLNTILREKQKKDFGWGGGQFWEVIRQAQ